MRRGQASTLLRLALAGWVVVASEHALPPTPALAPANATAEMLFYSFFIILEGKRKSNGHLAHKVAYEKPFANKLCYMSQFNYAWLLDIAPQSAAPKHMPPWYKIKGLSKWLDKVRPGGYLVYLDMDLVVKDPTVNFYERYTTSGADLVVTDHNRALNNGAFMVRNSEWGRRFLERWQKVSEDAGYSFPFTDNGSFISAILSFTDAWIAETKNGRMPCTGGKERKKSKSSNDNEKEKEQEPSTVRVGYSHSSTNLGHSHSSDAGLFLTCVQTYFKAAIGPFNGTSDRVLHTQDGGKVQFVLPARGFNSHEWLKIRPKQGWYAASCFAPGGFILHTKQYDTEVPDVSTQCDAAASFQGFGQDLLGGNLYGNWGYCHYSNPECANRLGGLSYADSKLQPLYGPHWKSDKYDPTASLARYASNFGGKMKNVGGGEKAKTDDAQPRTPRTKSNWDAGDGDTVSTVTWTELASVTHVNANASCARSDDDKVTRMGADDRLGLVTFPATGLLSMMLLLKEANMHVSCGGVLWQKGPVRVSKSKACPPQSLGGVRLQPVNFDRGWDYKRLSSNHLVHSDWGEVHTAWTRHQQAYGLSGAKLHMTVVLRDPVNRLFAAWEHGAHWNFNEVKFISRSLPAEKKMQQWRSFFWSFRDANNTVLRQTSETRSFEEFAAVAQLPLHNQQTRMMVGAPSSEVVDEAMSKLAISNLCKVSCVGVLDRMGPFSACLSRVFGLELRDSYFSQHNKPTPVSQEARRRVLQGSWADVALYLRATQLTDQQAR